MKYIDREGKITIEENGQDKFLRHLYHDRGGRVCLSLLTRPFVSKLGGILLNTRFSARFVSGFVRRNNIDLSLYKKQEFSSYNDFFTREIKDGLRKIERDEKLLISPCDGKVTVCPIQEDSRFFIKETEYTVGQLLRNEHLADRYLGGYAVILRLTVDDYHRYCYVEDGVKSANVKLPGIFHTVNPTANDARPIYRENAREYTLLKTEKFGTLVMMEVGAMMVGKITNHHQGSAQIHRGEEKGYFEFGGSTVVLLLQKDRVQIDQDLLENSVKGYETIVRMGERIGECKLSKGTGKNHS